MVTLFVVVIAIAVTIKFGPESQRSYYDHDPGVLILAAILWILAMCLIIAKIVFICQANISYVVSIKQHELYKETYTEQSKEFKAIIRGEFEKYPEYEKSIIDSIDSSIILTYPDLKENTVLMKTVDELLKYERFIFRETIEIQRLTLEIEKAKGYILWL